MENLFGTLAGQGASQLPPSAEPTVQLDSLLAVLDISDPLQLDWLLQSLSNSNLLYRLPSDQSQHRLTVRINSLISTQKVAGYRLASLWLVQSPAIWNAHLVNHAASWLTHIINLLASPATHNKPDAELLEAALSLATHHILSEASPSRQEFHRQVVTPNLVKFATVVVDAAHDLVESLNVFVHSRALYVLLAAINHHLRVHPASCRALSARLHTLCRKVLYTSERLRAASPNTIAPTLPEPLFALTVQVLSSLHLTGALSAKATEGGSGTGGGRATQAQLWHSTVAAELRSAEEAWHACVSSYDIDARERPAATATRSDAEAGSSADGLPSLPTDPMVATQVALGRLELLLGSRGRVGVIPLLLRIPTQRPVPVPFGTLLAFALSILRIGTHTPQKATSESTVCALQAAYLPRHYLASLSLISQLALLSPAAVSLQASEILSEVCQVAEAAKGSSSGQDANYAPRIKMAAFRTLVALVGKDQRGAGVALDPNGRATLRMARLCSSQIATVVLSPPGASDNTQSSNETNGSKSNGPGSSRKAKKARLYESDSVFGSAANPRDEIQRLQPEEIVATQAALQVLEVVFPHLTTDLSTQHHDLAHTSAQVVLALVEVLSASQASTSQHVSVRSGPDGPPTVEQLFCASLKTTSRLLRDSPSSMLALSLPRLTPLLVELTAASSSAALRSAASEALSSLSLARKGKMVPIARGSGFYPASTGSNDEFDATPEGSKLSAGVDHTLDLQPGGREAESIRNVLNLSLARDHDADRAPETSSSDRIDIDAITAESDSLAAAAAAPPGTHPDNSPFIAASGLGKGLPSPLSRTGSVPHSPGRASTLRDASMFSPDPVKPSYRPSTPRIGSPSGLDRNVSFGSAQKGAAARDKEVRASSSPPSRVEAAGVKLQTGPEPSAGAATSPAVAPATTEDTTAVLATAPEAEPSVVTTTATTTTAEQVTGGETEPSRDPPVAVTTTVVEETVLVPKPLVQYGAGDDDDDDEEMPQIDLGSSGSEGEEEGENDVDADADADADAELL